jgi:Fe-S cluster assembly scaffold protein SufB
MSTVNNKEKGQKVSRERSSTGTDIDLSTYSQKAKDRGLISNLNDLPADIKNRAFNVGIDAHEACRSGSFFQVDHSVLFAASRNEGLEIMNITEALVKYDWLSDYWWNAVKMDTDAYTTQAERKQNHGYFLRALPGTKVEFPLQACLFMTQDGLAQNVHNIIIAEEGSELHVITGCASAQKVRSGLHIGVSEFYVKKNAHITFTMIHNWAEEMAVRPRSVSIVEEDGIFLSNFICMNPVKTLQMYPTTYCVGKNAIARYNTILFAHPGSRMDVGSRVYLQATGSRAEVTARAISHGGDIVARGHLIGEVADIKAHLECRGLILGKKGTIHAIPELEGKVSNVDMSHEAAVGKIAEEEIQYLMARGLTCEEATAAIVRGFLDVEIKGLPEHLQEEMKKAVRVDEVGEYLF